MLFELVVERVELGLRGLVRSRIDVLERLIFICFLGELSLDKFIEAIARALPIFVHCTCASELDSEVAIVRLSCAEERLLTFCRSP